MHFQTFHSGSDEMDPLPLMAQRESDHCEKIGVPFLYVENEQGDSVWAYLWPADRVSARVKAELGQYTAEHYVLLVAQSRFLGTVAHKFLPYGADFKEWAQKLRYSALHWSYFPQEDFAVN